MMYPVMKDVNSVHVRLLNLPRYVGQEHLHACCFGNLLAAICDYAASTFNWTEILARDRIYISAVSTAVAWITD